MTETPVSEGRGIAKAATLIALGNIASRVLGLLRDVIIADYFGARGVVSAFRTAEFIPRQFYDLLVGGMISSALVPIFSQYAEDNKKLFWHVASLMLSLAAVLIGLVVLLAEIAAPQIAMALGGTEIDLILLTRLLRITIPAMLFLSLSGVLTGLLHALKRFTFPAFTAATFNAAIVISTLAGVWLFDLGIEVVAVGLLLGSILQILIQLPGLREASLRFEIDWRHPVLRQVARLYQPIILGLLVTLFQTSLDRRLANSTGESSLAWMQNATTLIQFPMGLVVVAISLATLPTLSRYAALSLEATQTADANQRFIETLTRGIKTVLLLIIPATVALFIMGQPIIDLLFEHGDFLPLDTVQTNRALRFYLIGLIFAAVDQLLVFGFYARQNTFTPAMVGVASVGVYLAAVYAPQLIRPLQMTDLVLADSLKHIGHMVMMLWVIRRYGTLRGHGMTITFVKSALAAGVMAIILWALTLWIDRQIAPDTLIGEALLVILPAVVGGSAYLVVLWLLKVEEISRLSGLVIRKIRS